MKRNISNSGKFHGMVLALALVLSGTSTAMAQNLQLHYDFGSKIYSNEEKGRPEMTATFEQFKADGLGSWFYFIDLDLKKEGVVGAYAEVSREFNLGKNSPFAAHLEYDGGLSSDGGVFQPAALFGGAWNGHNADYSATYSVQLLYKRRFEGNGGEAYNSVQLTGVWNLMFAGGKGTFAGYVDISREKDFSGKGQLMLMSEPQLWYNFNKNLSVGTEIEVSNNFIYNTDVNSNRTFFINPTLGVKFTF